MATKKLLKKIRTSRLPCHLSDDETIPTPLYTDSITFYEFKQLHYQNFQLESSKPTVADMSPSLQLDCDKYDKYVKATENVSSLNLIDRKTLSTRLGRAIRSYLQGDTFSQVITKKRVKCASVEPVMPEDLCMFYRYRTIVKHIKRTCDINLWQLLERIKEKYRMHKKDSIQTLYEDLSRLIVNFILSSCSDITFDKCKYLIERLEELEKIIRDRFHIKPNSKNLVTLSPIPSLKTIPSTNLEDLPLSSSKNSVENHRKNSSSLKNVTSTIYTYSTLPKTPTRSEPLLSEIDEESTHRQVLKLILLAKYIMAQIVHLLHYEWLANPHIEQLYPKDFKRKWEPNTIPGPPGMKGRRSDSQNFSSFCTAYDSNFGSIELDTEKPLFPNAEAHEESNHGSTLIRYFIHSQTLLDGFEENVVLERKENLRKYCIGKMKKWAIKYKREKVEKKYQMLEVVCKICAQKVKMQKIIDHSGLCRKLAELDKELKEVEIKLSDLLADTSMRSRELHTQLLVEKNEYQRLKSRRSLQNCQSSICPNDSFKVKLFTKNLSTASGGSVEEQLCSRKEKIQKDPILEKQVASDHGEEKEQRRGRTLISDSEKTLKRKNLPYLEIGTGLESSHKKDNTDISQKSCDSDLEENFRHEFKGFERNEKVQSQWINSGKAINKEEDRRKSFVEQLLDKFPQKYEGSPSLERDNSEKRITTKLKSLSQRKKFSEFTTKSGQVTPPRFFSDRPRIESASEEGDEIDSGRPATDEDVTLTLAYEKINKLLESSDGSEALKLSIEMSSSDKSIIVSPAVGRYKSSTVYKKSKFYFGQELNFEGITPGNNNFEEANKGERSTEDNLHEEDHDQEDEVKEKVEDKKGRAGKLTLFNIDRNDRNELKRDLVKPGVDKKILQELADLKSKIERKKNINSLYDVVKAKGKIMLNQEPYQKKMEMIKDDAIHEIEILKTKTEEQEIKSFADNFFFLLERRIQVGKSFQETQKALDALEGKTTEDGQDKKIVQRRFSLMRGNSSLSLTKRKLGFASTPTTLQPSADDQFSPFRSPITDAKKPKSSYSSQKMFTEFLKPPEEKENSTSLSSKRLTSHSSIDVSPGGKSEDSVHHQINDKLKKLEFQQKVLPELQEEGEDIQGTNQEDPSPFCRSTNLEHSFNLPMKDQNKSNTFDKKSQEEHPISFSLDEIIGDSPENKSDKFDQSNSNTTHMSSPLVKEAFSTHDDPTICAQSSKRTQNLTECTINILQAPITFQQEEEKKSPGTPSFEAPLIWRTSTAPARTLSVIKKQMMNKSTKNDLLDFVKNLTTQKDKTPQNNASNQNQEPNDVHQEPIVPLALTKERNQSLIERKLQMNAKLLGNKKITTCEEENEQDSDDSKPPKKNYCSNKDSSSNLNKFPLLKENSQGDQTSCEEDSSPNAQCNAGINKNNERVFVEDLADKHENLKDKEESPILVESPLIQKGYYSDSYVKKGRGNLTRQPLIGINDFELIDIISKGAYGRVWLVRRKVTNDLYAMKEINLAERSMKNSKELESLRKENKIFGLAKEDFVVRALFTFTHETYICFVMEYMFGGDFGDILYNYCALEEDVARFYIAEIVLALEYLHSLGTVHRDLKPDNILLDKNGHAKLTDFGLSETGLSKKMAAGPFGEAESPSIYQKKEQTINKLYRNKNDLDNRINLKLKGKIMERRSTIKGILSESREHENDIESGTEKVQESKEEIVKPPKLKKPHRLIGTPDYMAPEIILGQSITNYSIDWWSLGVLLFEFLCGAPPFNDDSPEKIYDNIVKLRIPWDQITIGYGEDCLSPEAADLIKKLLVVDYTQRLGANGAHEIKQHSFFKGIDWGKLRTQQAPIIPERKNEIDTSNFIRLGDKLKKKDQENPFFFIPKDKNAISNMQAAKELLEAASENFNIFNYAALDSDNLRVAEEALQQKERELKQLVSDEYEGDETLGIYDDIFDMPN